MRSYIILNGDKEITHHFLAESEEIAIKKYKDNVERYQELYPEKRHGSFTLYKTVYKTSYIA